MHIKATVKAGAARESVSFEKGRYRITVKEPAKDGRANAAARLLLAKHLGVPPTSLALIRGADKPSKIFLIRT